MKLIKAIFATVVLAAASIQASAQLGVTAGFTSSNTNIQDFTTSSVAQYNAGISLKLNLGGGLALQPSLVYQVKGASLEENINAGSLSAAVSTLDTSVGYLELPVQIQWGPDLVAFRPYVFAEPFVGYGITNDSQGNIVGIAESLKNEWENSNINRLEYGFGVGVGIELLDHFQVSGRYFWNFGGLVNEEGKVSADEVGNMITTAFKDQKNFNGMTFNLVYFF